MASNRPLPPHPIQPLVIEEGVIRFRKNKIVCFLQEWASQKGMDLNVLAIMEFSDEDWAQFAQLIGYSVSGFGDLSYAHPAIVTQADEAAEKLRKAGGS